ncbi:UDP-glucose 4-epimerase GalE [Chelatococcus reniformis]|nr:UDP-glucose 4-epimerase GalE [Chelatococcus reniformis]
MASQSILVVGGAGYVGGHTCKALATAGFRPVVFDNFTTGHRDFVRWGPVVDGDIRDAVAVADAIRSHDIAAVLHFAACAYVGESVTDPQKYYDNNVAGTLSLLRAMLNAGCSRLVFSSTCAIYGQPDEVPIGEATAPNPVNPYGASKLMVERILSDYARAYDIRAIALRYFNACGADPDGEIGELRDPETHLIPRAMMALQGYIDDFQIFGSDYSTADGTAVRDYIHVSDLADAHVAALRRLLDGQAGGAYNLGTGQGFSVKEVLDAIAAEAGEALPEARGPRREGDPAALIADARQAQDVLGFSPKYSDLPTIVRTAWAWHRRAHPRRNAEPEQR